MIRRILCVLVCLCACIPCAQAAGAYDFSDCVPGDIIRFGSCEQDMNTSNGYEPIEWIVLDEFGDRILVVSRYCLSGMAFDGDGSSYEDSDIRAFLNGPFYNGAFSDKERALIALTYNPNRENPDYGTEGGAGTQDRVFLLSHEECAWYFPTNETRRATSTAYCKASLKNTANEAKATGKYCFWWLRTPGKASGSAEYVFDSGRIYTYGTGTAITSIALRPAMVIFNSQRRVKKAAWINPHFE